MGNILGEPFKKYVQEQILQRQEIHGKINKSQKDITYLNSKNAWVKLGSGVSIDEKRMKMLEGNPMTQDVPLGSTLAQNNVLFNGLSNPIENLEGINKYSKIPRSGVGSDILDNGTSTNNQAYGVGGFGGISGNFGFSPMPGIIDADLKTLNRGSIKKATVNIKCFNKYQFDVIDVLYLRLGYSIFLEFGSSIYYSSDKELTTLDQSLMSEEYFFSSDYDKSDYSAWLPIIEERRKASGGNYDGMFGVVSNFSWTFGEDGSYNIKLEIISHGDVIESLKVNLPPLNKTGLTPQQKLQQQKETKELVKKANEDSVVDYSKKEFYDKLYPGLKEALKGWYDKGMNDNESNGLVYDMDTSWLPTLGSNFKNIYIRQKSLPPYTRTLQDTDIKNLSGEKLQNEINRVMGKALKLAVKYSFEGANWSLNTSLLNTLNINAINNLSTGLLTGQGPAADAYEASLMYKYQLEINPGDSDPGTAFPVLGNDNKNKLTTKTTRPETFFIAGSYIKAIKRFNYIYEHSYKTEKLRQKLLLSYIGFENLLTAFYLVLYTMYLKPNFIDSPDDVSFGDTDTDTPEEDSSTEPSQMALDQEQKGKNRIREYLYSLRYFDTISGGDLQNQSQIRQKFEETKANAFKYNIEEERESKNELNLSQIKPESLDNIVRVTVVNPNFKQTKSLTAADASYGKNDKWFWESGEDDMLKNAQEAVRNEKELSPEKITKNIKEWNNAKLFPKLTDDGNQIEIITLNINEPKYSYFIRLGTFLDFLQEKVIPKIETGNKKGQPLITIDTNPEKNICYVEQNTISFDPRKLIISNYNFSYSENDLESNLPIYKGLTPFQVVEKGYRYGKIMNVYFNFNRIQEIFDDVDVKNNISLFEVIKTLCNDINECLGGLNNLEPVITDETPETDPENPRFSYIGSKDYSGNTITIIDQTSIPGIEQIAPKLGLPNFIEEIYTLDIYGNRMLKDRENPDNPDINSSPFVKNIGLTTQIDKNYATMITIGATANGEIPGENSTAFSKWNVGVIDRFKNNVIDAVAETGSLDSQNEIVVKDYKTMTSVGNYLGLLGYNADLTINEDYINTQISTHANYFAYEQAVKTQAEIKKNLSGLGPGSMGFIPFNLKLTLDGISGIKIYNKIKVDTRFLPSNYPSTLKFLVTGIDHSLKDNMWETQLSTVATSAGMGTNESGEEGEYVEAVPYTDEELAEQEANDKEVNTQNIVNNSTKGNQTEQSSKADKEIKKENVQKKKNTNSKPQSLIPYKKEATKETAQTLGTSTGPISNPNAYKTPEQLEASIKMGLDQIDNIPSTIPNRYPDLRKRILRIAASYVGQQEIKKPHDNYGFLDPSMQDMYESLGWYSAKKNHYCNWSVWLWWYQAFTVGNAYVKPTDKYPYNFDKIKNHQLHPKDILSQNKRFKYSYAPVKVNEQPYGSGKGRGVMDQGTPNSKSNLGKLDKYIPINFNVDLIREKIKQHQLLPGDAIYYDWNNRTPNSTSSKTKYSNTSHIGMYLCPGDINCNTIWTIEGNTTEPQKRKVEGIFKKNVTASQKYGLKKVRGLGQLFTNDEF